MATLLLQAAGAFLGGALGPVGSAIGSAAGAMLGYTIDRALIDSTRHVEGPRLSGARPYNAEEGAPLPRIYGTARLAGNMIWATRFEEESRTERQGGKGGPRTTTYSYYANVAFALCEGPIAGVRRVWADGRELDLERVQMRIHMGTATQGLDPLIESVQATANTPAYRDTAYAVFEHFSLADYGNRIPQFQFEIMRPVGAVNAGIRAVALIPGSTEYGLAPYPVTLETSPGASSAVNRHVLHAATDLTASLDELQALCPALEHVGLVVTWFGDDLRAGNCTIRPKVTFNGTGGLSDEWIVDGVARPDADLVTSVAGSAAYGGTPSDRSVIAAIQDIKARGLKVTLYPFVMMDIAHGNALPDPYGGAAQAAYPWRGRITSHPAPGRPGTADKTSAARVQVAAFSGGATAGSFAVTSNTVSYSGAGADWGYRRMVLHYAHLAAVAGGVDAFLVGSELRGLTALRDGANAFPFVEQLCDLAGEVRAICGPATKISYGADWSEYFGHQPADGTGDVYFHLDPLWAHPAIDAVGIDNYMPLADWRDGDEGGGNPEGFASPYDVAAMRAAIEGGEGHDWYYANAADRLARIRTPITDGAHGKPWVFSYKALQAWWGNQHFNRPGGIEAGGATAWVPQSKPIWFTEIGCPAVDKGPNQPNVFPDPKSSENAAPYFSSGGRADEAPAAFAEAHIGKWDADAPSFVSARNPVSAVYGSRMVERSRIYFWAWDARPYPAFPRRSDVWNDGSNWLLGHWLNGRLEGVRVGDLINAILRDSGEAPADVVGVTGSVGGYVIDRPTSVRAALEPVAELFGLTASSADGTLAFRGEDAGDSAVVELDDIAMEDGAPATQRTRTATHELPAETEIAFADRETDYQSAVARYVVPGATHRGRKQMQFPGVLEAGQASALVADWTRRVIAAREEIAFAVEPGRIDVEPGATVRLSAEEGISADYLVTEVELGAARRVKARQLRRVAPSPWRTRLQAPPLPPVMRSAPAMVAFVDLPMLPAASAPEDQLKVAVRARPWLAHGLYASASTSGYERRGLVTREATIGILAAPLPAGREAFFARSDELLVDLFTGALSSADDDDVLNGANLVAVEAANGEWEVLQFGSADEVSPGRWRLKRLLRGQFGTRPAMLAGAALSARLVVIDSAVISAGLAAGDVGLPRNWKVGPLGYDLGSGAFSTHAITGGLRAIRPPAPVHLRVRKRADGGRDVSWKRRSRLTGDRGIGFSPPLGEDVERYWLELRSGGTLKRSAELSSAGWTYAAAQIAVDFPAGGSASVTIRQIGNFASGDAASISFSTD